MAEQLSWLEHSVHTRSVVGSSPISATKWPGGQAVKTPPFHGGNTSSILVRVTILISRSAGVVEQADTRDLKSLGLIIRTGSSPVTSTRSLYIYDISTEGINLRFFVFYSRFISALQGFRLKINIVSRRVRRFTYFLEWLALIRHCFYICIDKVAYYLLERLALDSVYLLILKSYQHRIKGMWISNSV